MGDQKAKKRADGDRAALTGRGTVISRGGNTTFDQVACRTESAGALRASRTAYGLRRRVTAFGRVVTASGHMVRAAALHPIEKALVIQRLAGSPQEEKAGH